MLAADDPQMGAPVALADAAAYHLRRLYFDDDDDDATAANCSVSTVAGSCSTCVNAVLGTLDFAQCVWCPSGPTQGRCGSWYWALGPAGLPCQNGVMSSSACTQLPRKRCV